MKNYVGLDLGTSSVKVLQRFENGETRKVSRKYDSPLPGGWSEAAVQALASLDLSETCGIGLSSQVGTYLVDGCRVISWNDSAGEDEIDQILALRQGAAWEEEISMRHPRLISYPLPRLLYILRHIPEAQHVCQPKEFLLTVLTGEEKTDPWSWRGLCRVPGGPYSTSLLKEIGADAGLLPRISGPEEKAGVTRSIHCGSGRIPPGIPVFTGMNDFFASLLGMGMHPGELFDITGTSEHWGSIEDQYRPEEQMVNGPWLTGYAHYGVTASSGASLNFGGRLDEELFQLRTREEAEAVLREMAQKRPPVFLPYLNGERAPIWNPEARGVFFGISGSSSPRELAYAVMEGVCFSLMHIHQTLGDPQSSLIRVSGGASANPLMNRMKAELFQKQVAVPAEKDTSALGAAMTAMVGNGRYDGWQEAMEAECRTETAVFPTGEWTEWLHSRYSIYRELYPALKTLMKEWRNLI